MIRILRHVVILLALIIAVEHHHAGAGFFDSEHPVSVPVPDRVVEGNGPTGVGIEGHSRVAFAVFKPDSVASISLVVIKGDIAVYGVQCHITARPYRASVTGVGSVAHSGITGKQDVAGSRVQLHVAARPDCAAAVVVITC